MVMVVENVSLGSGLYGGQRAGTLQNAAGGAESVGKFRHGRGRAAQRHGFQTVMFVQMHVHGGEHHVVRFMLKGGEAARQVVVVMVVHQRQHSGHRSFGVGYDFFRKFPPDAVAQRLGAVGKALALTVTVKGRKQVALQFSPC